jgi:hypothetical protein
MEQLKKIIEESIWKYHHYKEADVTEHFNFHTKNSIITVKIDMHFIMQENNDEEGIEKIKKFVSENPYKTK